MIPLLPDEQAALTRHIRTLTSISLDASKSYLIQSRLSGLLAETGCASFSELYSKARLEATGKLNRKIVDAITTNETSFFRDASPFELLRHKILPDLVDRRTKTQRGGAPIPLRIWSAACSTGQEVYSIAIVLKELLVDLDRYNIHLIGTDISDQAVAQASRGVFRRIEIERGLSPSQLARYFTPQGGDWKVSDEIRSLAAFRTFNLAHEFASLGRFDVVLCRNVAIYFSEPDRISLFQRIGKTLAGDGYLIIGGMETLPSECSQFESKRYLRSVFYRPKPMASGGARFTPPAAQSPLFRSPANSAAEPSRIGRRDSRGPLARGPAPRPAGGPGFASTRT